MAKFSMRQAYRHSFRSIINNIVSLLPILAIWFVAAGVGTYLGRVLKSGVFFGLIAVVLMVALTVFLTIGIERVGFDLIDRGKTNWRRMLSGASIMWIFYLSALIYSLIVVGGCFLLLIPGIVWAVKYGFHDLFIVDTECSPMESIRRSGQLTEGHKVKLFFFSLLNYVIVSLSLGVLYPVIIFARISVYRQLQNKIKQDEEQE